MILIFIIALIVVGPRRLPEIGRSLGKILNDLRKMSQEFTAQMTQDLNAPAKENETKRNETREIADQNVPTMLDSPLQAQQGEDVIASETKQSPALDSSTALEIASSLRSSQ